MRVVGPPKRSASARCCCTTTSALQTKPRRNTKTMSRSKSIEHCAHQSAIQAVSRTMALPYCPMQLVRFCSYHRLCRNTPTKAVVCRAIQKGMITCRSAHTALSTETTPRALFVCSTRSAHAVCWASRRNQPRNGRGNDDPICCSNVS